MAVPLSVHGRDLMYTTRLSLIQSLKGSRNEVAWQEFYDLYKSLIYRYARQRGLNSTDAEEIVSACFEKLSQVMAEFEYRPTRGKFKSWLRQLASHKISHLLAHRGRAELLPNSELDLHCSSPCDAVWERTWQREVLTYCVQQAQAEVSTRNYSVFQLSVYDDWTAREIAQALDMSPQEVYQAKHKVLRIVREKMAKYLEE